MYNAMFKKNPVMSMWMSAANSASNSARGLWMAEMHRQQIAMMDEMTKQMIRFWTGAWMPAPARANGQKLKSRR